MIRTIFKFFFIAICCPYTFAKLLNINYKKTFSADIFFAIFSACISGFLYIHASQYIILVFALLFILYIQLIYKKNMYTTISFSILSICINYFFSLLSIVLLLPVNIMAYNFFKNDEFIDIALPLLFGIIQLILIYFLFHIKRFKNGLPFLKSKISNDMGIFISILLLFTASLLYTSHSTFTITPILIFLSILLGFSILFWWRHHIRNNYLEKIRRRDIENMEKTISGLKSEIDKLKTHNDEMAKIIHKDNKLIPAMEMAVKAFINSDNDVYSEKAESLIGQLDALSSERKGILHNYESSSRILPHTGIASVDALLSYLLCRANKKNVHFDISINCNVKQLVSSIISENDLNTLLADLGENALISASEKQNPNVLIVISIEESSYRISFYDNGDYFDSKALKYLGRKQYTTHADTGGSGIGMLTTFEIIHKYKASFEINESIRNEQFTKRVSILLNNKAEINVFKPTN